MAYIGRQNLGGAYRQLDDISSGFDGSDTTHTMQVNSQNVTVGDVNPILVTDSVTVNEGQSVTINVSTLLSNDFDFQQSASTLKVTSVTSAKFGSISTDQSGGAVTAITYGPKSGGEDFNGLDTFTYTVEDSQGNMATAAVSVDVAAVNDAPDATTAKILGIENAVASGRLAASDIDGDAVTFQLVSQPTNSGGSTVGTLSISPNGTYTYAAASDYLDAGTSETLSFTYRVSDGTATVDKVASLVVMAATENDDVIYGGEGSDTIYAGTGDDQVDGGAGNDVLDGGLGADNVAADELEATDEPAGDLPLEGGRLGQHAGPERLRVEGARRAHRPR